MCCGFNIFDIVSLGGQVLVGLAFCEFINCILGACSFAESNISMCIICATIILGGLIFYVKHELTHLHMQNVYRNIHNDMLLEKIGEAVGVSEFDKGAVETDEVEEEVEEGVEEEAEEGRKVTWKDGELLITFEIRGIPEEAVKATGAASSLEADEIRDTLSRETPTPTAEIEATTEFRDLFVSEGPEEPIDTVEFVEPVPTMPTKIKTTAAQRRGRKKIAA
jgi:hypothetical protein